MATKHTQLCSNRTRQKTARKLKLVAWWRSNEACTSLSGDSPGCRIIWVIRWGNRVGPLGLLPKYPAWVIPLRGAQRGMPPALTHGAMVYRCIHRELPRAIRCSPDVCAPALLAEGPSGYRVTSQLLKPMYVILCQIEKR